MMNKTAGMLWSIGSLGIFVVVVLYVGVYQPPSGVDAEKATHLLNHWTLISNIWRAEMAFVLLLTISSLYFAIRSMSIAWITVGFGHIIMATMYPLMLGGYPIASEYYADVPTLFPLINKIAVWIFAVSNILFLIGMASVFYADNLMKKWLSRTGMFLSLMALVLFIALYFDLLTFNQVIIVGPLVNIIYLINVYYGIKIFKEN